MDNVFQSIFNICDPTNSNFVRVELLVEYIANLILSSNKKDLLNLQDALDPNGVNPKITYEQFSSVMLSWRTNLLSKSSVITGETKESNEIHLKIVELLKENDDIKNENLNLWQLLDKEYQQKESIYNQMKLILDQHMKLQTEFEQSQQNNIESLTLIENLKKEIELYKEKIPNLKESPNFFNGKQSNSDSKKNLDIAKLPKLFQQTANSVTSSTTSSILKFGAGIASRKERENKTEQKSFSLRPPHKDFKKELISLMSKTKRLEIIDGMNAYKNKNVEHKTNTTESQNFQADLNIETTANNKGLLPTKPTACYKRPYILVKNSPSQQFRLAKMELF